MRLYQIKEGDTFNQIAINFRIPASALKFANQQVEDVNVIKTGDYLHIPQVI